jgi:hypothetical protein
VFPGRGTVIGWSSLLNSIGCSDQYKYFVVTGGDVIAKLTCQEFFFLFVRLRYRLYHCGDVSFGWDVSFIIIVSLIWLTLSLCRSVGCLLICWRCIVCVSIIALPLCFGLLISRYFLEFQERHAILHCMSGHPFAVDECIVYMEWSV